MIKYKSLIINILIPNVIGFISSLLGKVSTEFDAFNKPTWTPPGIVFPIVWTILYILMGISSYLIYESNNTYKNSALKVYGSNILINGLWSILFFRFKLFFVSFLTIIILIILTLIMIIKYFKINKAAGLIQIPYLIWLFVALALSYNVYLLN